jgi:hypothetical protein
MEATTINTTEKLSAWRWMVLTIIVLVQFQIQLSFGLRNTLALFSWIELVAILMFKQLPTIVTDNRERGRF